MASNFKWNGARFMGDLNAKLEQRLDRAALLLQSDIVAKFPSPPPEPKKNGKGMKRNSSKAWKRGHPSAPGGLPMIQTGTLKRSIAVSKPGPLKRRVGSGVKYARWLEFGTRRMEPRPFLMPALRRNKEAIVQQLTVKI